MLFGLANFAAHHKTFHLKELILTSINIYNVYIWSIKIAIKNHDHHGKINTLVLDIYQR